MGNTMSSTEQEPAKISYFYGPGFKDIVKVVQTTGKKIRDSVDAITTASASKTPPVGIIMTILVMSVRYAYWLFSAGTMVIASVFFCLFMLMPHVVGFIVIDIVGLLLSRIVRLLDMLYFQIRKVSNVCDVCHNRFTVPVYVCDKCGAKHFDPSGQVRHPASRLHLRPEAPVQHVGPQASPAQAAGHLPVLLQGGT